jgi:hypothetical protein
MLHDQCSLVSVHPFRAHSLLLDLRYFTAIWSLLQPFIDPVTRQKIQILGSNYLDELREVIDDSQIPVEYGGQWEEIKWSWPYPEESGCSPKQIDEYNQKRAATR